MISDADVEQAIEHMRDSAPRIAKAKSERVYLEHFLKSKRSILFAEAPGKSVGEREHWAYRHDDYITLLQALRDAVSEDERLRFETRSNEVLIEVWRTQQANQRGSF